MKHKTLSGMLAVVFAACAIGFSNSSPLSARPNQKPQEAKICSDPSVPCRTSVTFEAYDLPFRVPENAVIWETEQFYAIILKSVPAPEGDCARFIAEDERLQAQALFPHRKVFTSRCGDPGNLFYTNVAPNQQFMAVYAGETKAEAERVLATVKATGKYPGANIRRMRAGFNGT
jgi:hypothetical protein